MKKNDTVRVEITDLNNLGFGVGHVEGKTLFVGGAVDGETVLARVLTVKSTYAVGKVEKLLVASPHRTEPVCPVRGCGGCAYASVSYGHELALKEGYVRAAFHKVGIEADVQPVSCALNGDGTPRALRYRNKSQYPVAAAPDGGYRIGFYAPKSHRVVEAACCPLQPACFEGVVATLRELFARFGISAYDEETGEGLVRHIYLRRGEVSGQVLLTLVLNGARLPHSEEIVLALREAHPELVGILVNENTARTNVICGDKWHLLWGQDYLEDTLGGVRLRIHPAAFYQVNHAAAELLYAKAKELACLTGREQVLDLYCGCGSIGLSMADAAGEVIGIEIEPSAVRMAQENARLNGIGNARFWCGDASSAERLLGDAALEMGLHPDVVVLDPPRKGTTQELMNYLAGLAVPRIVYISCNPDTLARDVSHFLSLGYEMSAVYPVDLFPRTGHVESVVCLTRK